MATRIEYDPCSYTWPTFLVQSTTYADATTTATAVIYAGLTLSTQTKTGVATRVTYDGLGNQIRADGPRSNEWSATILNPATLQVSETQASCDASIDPSGHLSTHYAYYAPDATGDDAWPGRLWQITNPAGLSTYYGYDARGALRHTWGAVPQPTWVEYDSFGQRTALHTYRMGSSWGGNTWPGGAGDLTTWAYDVATGLLTAKTDADGQAVHYTYTADGKLATRTWARGVVTTYAYDANTGELHTIDYSNKSPSPDLLFAYNRLGQLLTVTDADPNATSHSFSYANWPAQVTETMSGLFSKSITRAYDPSVGGRLTDVMIGDGTAYTASYRYDAATGRLNRVTGPGLPTGTGINYGAWYTYTTNSDLVAQTAVQKADGTLLAHTNRVYEPQRDLLDYVENVWDPSPATTVSKYDYTNDALARRTSVAHTGSAFSPTFTQTLGYNDGNELTSARRNDNATLARAYAYDPIGNRASSDANSPAVRTTYVTNNLNEYTQQHRPVGSTTWMQSLDYDEDGDLTHSWAAGDMNCDGHVDPNDVDAFNLALQGEAAYEAVYRNCDWLNGDTNGDGTVNLDDINPFLALINGTGSSLAAAYTYVWDGENRLSEVRPTFPVSTSKKVTFAYDYLGRRVLKKAFNWSNGQWSTSPSYYRKYLWDGWLLLAEMDAFNTPQRKYTWGLDLAGLNGGVGVAPANLQSAGGIGGLLAAYDASGSRTFVYFYDGNGNVGQVVETTAGANYGRLVKYEYDPYGNRTNTPGTGEYDQPWRFNTKQFDAETGLGYWGYRYYNPSLGRWMSWDPIGRRGGPNLLRAFKNDAVDWIDALGLSPYGVLDGPHDALMHYLIGEGETAELSSRLIGILKDLDFYHELILTTIPKAVDALVPADCGASTHSASASGGVYGASTAPVAYVGGTGFAKEPNYSFDLNTAVGTINSVTWKVTCTVGTGSKPGSCCCGYAKACTAHFVLNDVYTFNTGYKDYVFQKLFGDWWGGKDYRIHNEWDEHVSPSTKTICK